MKIFDVNDRLDTREISAGNDGDEDILEDDLEENMKEPTAVEAKAS